MSLREASDEAISFNVSQISQIEQIFNEKTFKNSCIRGKKTTSTIPNVLPNPKEYHFSILKWFFRLEIFRHTN